MRKLVLSAVLAISAFVGNAFASTTCNPNNIVYFAEVSQSSKSVLVCYQKNGDLTYDFGNLPQKSEMHLSVGITLLDGKLRDDGFDFSFYKGDYRYRLVKWISNDGLDNSVLQVFKNRKQIALIKLNVATEINRTDLYM